MKKAAKILRFFSWVLFVVAAVAAISVVIMLMLGVKLYCVRTGSMYPTYPIGTLIFVNSAEFEELSVGDVVTYAAGDSTVVTHRIVGINEKNRTIETQGDSNTVSDGWMRYENVIGRVIFGVPLVGYAGLIAQTRFGKIMIAIFLFGIIAVEGLRRMWDSAKDEEDEEDEDEEGTEEAE